MMNDEYYMKLALDEAKKAFDEDEVPIGAVIVDNKTGEILSFGRNSTRHDRIISAHAEMNAIIGASEYRGGHRLNDCSLYVTLEPCPMCAGACIMSGVSRVIFGASDEKNGAVVSKDKLFERKFTVTPSFRGKVMENESKELLKSFFEEKRKNKVSVTFSAPITDYQKDKFYKISGIYPDEKAVFVRKNGKIAGTVAFRNNILEITVTKEYSAYLTQKEISELYEKK